MGYYSREEKFLHIYFHVAYSFTRIHLWMPKNWILFQKVSAVQSIGWCSRIIYIVMFCDTELCCGYNYDDNDQYRLSVD